MHDPFTEIIGHILIGLYNRFMDLSVFFKIGLILGLAGAIVWTAHTVKSNQDHDEPAKTFIECVGDDCVRYALECDSGKLYKTTIGLNPVIKPVYYQEGEQAVCDTEGYVK